MVLTMQNLLKMKLFGDYLPETRPLQYRTREWQELVRGKERAVRLLVKSLLGVPSAHHGDQDQQIWCFQFSDGGLLTVFLRKGGGQVQFAAKDEAQSAELLAGFDFLFNEISARLRAL